MIEKLPDVPFGQIWRELSYEDRVSLRRACKSLKCLVDRQKCANLFLFLDCYPCHKTLSLTNEFVDHSDSYHVPNIERFISNREQFKSLRKLAIFFRGFYSFDENFDDKEDMAFKFRDKESFLMEVEHLKINLKHLNFFEHLEHLELEVRSVC